MKKKIILSLLLVISIFGISACATKDAKQFKEDYEKLNGQTNKSGKAHRSVKIDEENPFIYATAEEIVEKINNKETFYVYFGDDLCPWCRSAIEKAIEVAKKNKIDKIYYIAIWDDDGKEILRDKYELKDGEITKTIDGTESYKKLLEKFDSVLSEYNLTDENGDKVSTGEKRIYAPNYIYVKDGVAVKLVEGTSENQKDSREELTKELLDDEEKIFNDFFNN
ncbi:MAG: hypothetical protein IJ572_02920 [Bacilli bacterium]|nr:hypothetical protein [Bacilli bacterium]